VRLEEQRQFACMPAHTAVHVDGKRRV
jgi:hypothetical protein